MINTSSTIQTKILELRLQKKMDVIVECKRQLYDIITYLKLSIEEVDILIAKIQSELLEVVNKFVAKKKNAAKKRRFS